MQETDKITKESMSEEEKKNLAYETGEKEADVYSDEGIENLQEDEDEISPAEAGFMEGAKGVGHLAKCATCGKILGEDIVEKEVQGDVHRFCDDTCATKFQVKDNKD